jgi:hypothetical protein
MAAGSLRWHAVGLWGVFLACLRLLLLQAFCVSLDVNSVVFSHGAHKKRKIKVEGPQKIPKHCNCV